MNQPTTSVSGIAVIDKPAGWTSHQVVGRIRRLCGTRKVGHAGTLDPMATGVLVVGVNKATRLLGHLMLTDKEYAATIRLGQTTITDDADGELVTSPGAAGIDQAQVAAALGAFRGPIMQVPTAVSAIKVNGKRSYARVRAGEDVALVARPVTVSRFELVSCRSATAEGGVGVLDCAVEVTCASGTYIRALARDLGAALGCGGHLTSLRRTRVGPFSLDEAQRLDETTEWADVLGIDAVVARCFPTHPVDAAIARAISHGQRLPGVRLDGLTAMTEGGRFLALYRPDGEDAVAEAVFG